MSNKKYQYVVVAIVILACLGISGWFYYSTGKYVTPTTTTVKPAEVSVLSTDFASLLTNRIKFTEQQPIEIQTIPVGRDNPFAPY